MDVFAQKTTLQIIKDSPIYFLEQKKKLLQWADYVIASYTFVSLVSKCQNIVV